MPVNFYFSAKTLHIIAIISWMAGILYFFRLFIYHRERGEHSSEIHDLLCLMERRLFRFITLPAMGISILSGMALIWIHPEYLGQTWFHIKILCVILLSAATLFGFHLLKRFRERQFSQFSGMWLRILNEVPTLLMVIIVAMVIFRP